VGILVAWTTARKVLVAAVDGLLGMHTFAIGSDRLDRND
jgi:hypothetical protein